ncbi:MAG: rhodanese-like domain-containing protein [Gammaproteobacteria bacterium]
MNHASVLNHVVARRTIATLTLALASIAANSALAQQPAAQPAAAEQAPTITQKLSRNQVDGFLAYPDQVLFVDIRRPDEITNIGGFPTYLSVQLKDLEAGTVFIPRDRTLLLVSNHANRALKAGDILLGKGFKVGGAVGVQDYEKEGGKIVKIAAPAPKVATAN